MLLDVPDELASGIEALRARSEWLQPLIAELDALEQGGRLATTRASLASSFVHMYVNRLVRSAPRLHELVLYDWLLRLYESRAARVRSTAHRKRPRKRGLLSRLTGRDPVSAMPVGKRLEHHGTSGAVP